MSRKSPIEKMYAEGDAVIGSGERANSGEGMSSENDTRGKQEKKEREYTRENVIKRLKEFVGQLKMTELNKLVLKINELNRNRDKTEKIEIYLTGGCVKDVGGKNEREFNDIDVVIRNIKKDELFSGDGSGLLEKCGEVKDKTKKSQKGKKIETIPSIYSSFQLILNNEKIGGTVEFVDVVQPREEDPETGLFEDNPNLPIIDDLKRRLSRKDSVAVNILNGEIIEGEEGALDDVASGLVRATGETPDMMATRLLANPIRAIQLIKLASEDGAYFDDDTIEAVSSVFKESNSLPANGDEKKIEKLNKLTKKVFKISSNENLPEILKICWNETKKTFTTKTSRDQIGKVVLNSMNENTEKFIKNLREVSGLKLLFPEINELDEDNYEELLSLLGRLPKESSMELKFAVLLSKGKEDSSLKNIADRFNFNKELFCRSGASSILQKRKISELTALQISNLISDCNKGKITDSYVGFIDDLIGFARVTGESEEDISNFKNKIKEVKEKMKTDPILDNKIIKFLFIKKKYWPKGFNGGNMAGLLREAQLEGDIITEEDAWKFIVKKVKAMGDEAESNGLAKFYPKDIFSEKNYEKLKEMGLLD